MDERVESIRTNFDHIHSKILRALWGCSDPERQVRIVTVSKGQAVDVIQDAFDAGIRLFGENYPEESEPKIQALAAARDVEWHMIGHLQSRKAGIVVDHFDMLHSLDRMSLAVKLERKLAEAQKRLPVLLEFNVGGEESKSGWLVTDISQLERTLPEIEEILSLSHLQVRGLMTMPPLFDNPGDARPFFVTLRKIQEHLTKRWPDQHWQELSMGTSSDYQVAVEEGATIVRIGTAILGPRPSKHL